MKIVLIGAGNVAVHLGPALAKKKHKIIQVFSRSKKSGEFLSKKIKCSHTNDPGKINRDADVYIVALRDDAIAPFLSLLKFNPNLIVHTSGSVGIDVFPKRMKNTGVMYPLQTFSKESKNDPGIIPFCIEGSNALSEKSIQSLAKTISRFVYKVNSSDRAYIHLSAVFVNNFSNYLFSLSEKLLRDKKISFELLRPLILETALKVQDNLPGKVQTGPAKRGDATIIKKHMKLLNEYPEMKKIYSLLSGNIEKDFGPRL